jgi:hypothetical protein
MLLVVIVTNNSSIEGKFNLYKVKFNKDKFKINKHNKDLTQIGNVKNLY